MTKQLKAIAGEVDIITNAMTDRTVRFTKKVGGLPIDFTDVSFTEFTFTVRTDETAASTVFVKTLTGGTIVVDSDGHMDVTFTNADLDLGDASYVYSLTYVENSLIIPVMIGRFITEARA